MDSIYLENTLQKSKLLKFSFLLVAEYIYINNLLAFYCKCYALIDSATCSVYSVICSE